MGPSPWSLQITSVRWREAGGEPIELSPPVPTRTLRAAGRFAPIASPLGLESAAPTAMPSRSLQIRDLYRDAISAARELIYIENQYFTADAIAVR